MKKLLLGVTLGILVATAGGVVYVLVFQAPSDEPEWILSAFSGDVAVRLGGSDWQPATVKARLRGRDQVRTLEGGEATLINGESHVTIRSDTEVAVEELVEGSSKFQVVGGGMVFVEARGNRIRMSTFAGQEADAVDAGFGMSVTDEGLARVQVKRGQADFTSMGQTERVVEGHESEARAGRPPTRATEIPRAILLDVRFPDADTFNSRLARIEGRARPGDRVVVDGTAVETDENGAFVVDVEMEEGMNQLEVTTTDSIGRTKTERSKPINVDTSAPSLSDPRIGRRTIGSGG